MKTRVESLFFTVQMLIQCVLASALVSIIAWFATL